MDAVTNPSNREPTKIGRYEILRVLGRGAMGKVYLARDTVIGRLAALKTFVVAPGGLSEGDEDPLDQRKRLVREARAAGAVSHPNIVTVYDVLEADDEELGEAAFYIAMEYVEGRGLDQAIKEETYLDPLPIVRQIAAALDHLHQNGIVHRDIKPANILLARDGTVKLTDFGVARPSDPNATHDNVLFGTPLYMAPEVLRGGVAGPRSEVFALGVIVYEMLTGGKPFTGKTVAEVTQQILKEPYRDPTVLIADFAPSLRNVLDQALAKDPGKRFASAGALYAALAAAKRDLAPPDETMALTQTAPTVRYGVEVGPPSAQRLLILGLAALVVGLGILVAQSWVSREPEMVVDAEVAAKETTYLMLVAEGRRLLAAGDPAAAAIVFGTAGRLGVRGDEIRALSAEATAAATLAGQQGEVEEAQRAIAETAPAAALDTARKLLRQRPEGQSGGTASALADAEKVLAGPPESVVSDADPAVAAAAGLPSVLTLTLDSDAPKGVLTVYIAGVQVLNEAFSFYEKSGWRGRKAVSGRLERGFSVPSGPQTIRVLVTRSGEAAQLLEFEHDVPADGALALQLELPTQGRAVGNLVAVATGGAQAPLESLPGGDPQVDSATSAVLPPADSAPDS